MNNELNPAATDNPFQILGLDRDADEHAVRARYLELVKQFPPEREPEKFRQIQAAYEAARNPLLIARSMLVPPDPDDLPTWQEAIEAHAKRPPAMQPDFVLSLGNRSNVKGDDSVATADGKTND